MKVYFLMFFLSIVYFVRAQGHIDNIKNQPYLKLDIDCNCKEDSCSTSIRNRFCANKTFQKADEELTNSYNELLGLMDEFSSPQVKPDSLKISFVRLQKEWRGYRKNHCKVFWSDPTCNGNYCGTIYLNCLTYITRSRKEDFDKMIKYYREQIQYYKEEGLPLKVD